MNSDTSKQAAVVLTAIYRKMSPADKIARLFSAYETGRKFALAGLKSRFPEASEETLWQLWAKHHLGEKLYKTVYGDAQNE